jgi:hypothetical protein
MYLDCVMNDITNNTNPETTISNPTAPATKQRGRVKGVSDSVLISVAELQRRFGDTGMVPVRRTWLVEQSVAAAAQAALAGVVAIPSAVRSPKTAPSETPASEPVAEKIAFSVS